MTNRLTPVAFLRQGSVPFSFGAKVRIFYDCEFVERGRDLPIQLVSIGMIRDDGTELYRINPESLSNVSKHPWLSVNVGPYLPIKASPGILA